MLFIVLFGLIAAVIAFFIVRKSGGIIRHIVTFIILAIAIAIFGAFVFDSFFPYGSPRRNLNYTNYFAGGAATAIVCPILGFLAGWFSRSRGRAES